MIFAKLIMNPFSCCNSKNAATSKAAKHSARLFSMASSCLSSSRVLYCTLRCSFLSHSRVFCCSSAVMLFLSLEADLEFFRCDNSTVNCFIASDGKLRFPASYIDHCPLVTPNNIAVSSCVNPNRFFMVVVFFICCKSLKIFFLQQKLLQNV